MRKILVFILSFYLFAFVYVPRDLKLPCRVSWKTGRRIFVTASAVEGPASSRLMHILSRIEQGRWRGEFKLRKAQIEPLTGFVHERLQQFWKDVRIVGAEVVLHRKGDKVFCINGLFFEDAGSEGGWVLSRQEAVAAAKEFARDSRLETEGVEKVLLPTEEDFRPAYLVVLRRMGRGWKVYVDAETGEVLWVEDMLRYSSAIGLGYGVFQDKKKFDAWYTGSTYQSIGRMRPAEIVTYDMMGTWTTGWVAEDSDNIWHLGPLVDAHVYAGYVYDFYFKKFSRKGIDNANMRILSFVRFGSGYNNAFWDGQEMVYGNGDGVFFRPFSAGLDVVAHELSHGVTQFTCDLIYNGESGALNEAFSDIMATACEFEYQPEGTGFLKADWWIGEDLFYTFGYIIRSLRMPYQEGGYPDHISLKYTGSSDYGGVHINSTIISHAFYLLAHGGTHRLTGVHVDGIGLEKASKIFYRAYVYYLFPSANFSDVRQATLRAASDLYSGAEVEQVRKAWDAVGIK